MNEAPHAELIVENQRRPLPIIIIPEEPEGTEDEGKEEQDEEPVQQEEGDPVTEEHGAQHNADHDQPSDPLGNQQQPDANMNQANQLLPKTGESLPWTPFIGILLIGFAFVLWFRRSRA